MRTYIYQYFKILIKSLIEEVFLLPVGILYYLHLRKKDYFDIVICDHIGDFLFTAGYMEAFKKENHLPYIRMIGTEKFYCMKEYYKNTIEEYRVIRAKYLKLLLLVNRYRLGKMMFCYIGTLRVIEPSSDFVLEYKYIENFPELTLKTCIQYGILQLPKEAPFIAPAISKQKEKKKENKKILLCPEAQVIENEKIEEYFNSLIPLLKKENYICYMNVKNCKIKDVISVYDTLDQFFNLADEMDCVLGVRSGILDLAAFTKSKIIALYPQNSKMGRFYDLHITNPENHRLFQYNLTENRTQDIENIMNLIKEEKRGGS